ncbi:ACT domain-containing protein [Clostridium paraputrificum]|uniref:ACT domain-containing protein n=1 Tax=Clostridium TaxID=1485 RepID=UPI003D3451F6
MKMTVLEGKFVVCRLDCEDVIPNWVDTKSFISITRTEAELSIVCADKNVPDNIKCEKEWKALKVEGPLDFSLIGILAKISSLLAEEKISIFAISTFDTDYILLKEENLGDAIKVLTMNGIDIN